MALAQVTHAVREAVEIATLHACSNGNAVTFISLQWAWGELTLQARINGQWVNPTQTKAQAANAYLM